jgi:hypothetical protein
MPSPFQDCPVRLPGLDSWNAAIFTVAPFYSFNVLRVSKAKAKTFVKVRPVSVFLRDLRVLT